MKLKLAMFCLGTALFAQPALSAPAGPGFEKRNPIAAPDDRWDFASWDAIHHLVLVAHGKDVLVIDPAHGNAVHAVGSIAGAHGVVAIPGTNTLLVTSAKDNTARVIDETTGAQLAAIPVAKDPDAVILSASGRRAYVMAADAGAISILDLVNYTEIGRIPLKPALEVPVLVTPGLLAVNNEAANEIEFANLTSRKPAGSLALNGCTAPTGLAYDATTGLALSSCANGKAALVDLRARRVVALLPIGDGPDTVIWDAARSRFLVPCGKTGTLSVIRLIGRRPVVETAVPTERSARTAAFDPATGHVYLPAAGFVPATEPGKRETMEPGSFHIVVLGPTN
ncbi:YncE family protein [Novosphingobium sp.]|uniref:YncE family protein n=1 Tax=Novosphingobium sp. TaxID=1874826 RepID=UPI003B52C0CF